MYNDYGDYDEDEFDADDRYCYYGSDPDDEDDNPYEFDCGFIPGYGCQLAGSEDCDWECTYRDDLKAHPDYPNVTLIPIGDIKGITLIDLKHSPDKIQP